jgi:hypothetical protein
MKHVSLSLLLAGVVVGAAAMVLAARQKPEERAKSTQQYDPNGQELKPGKEPGKPAADTPARKKAKFELYHETTRDLKWEIEVVFDPRVYPYKVLGGEIRGSISGGRAKITEGTFGPGLMLKAQENTGTPHSYSDVVILGAAVHPSGYTGTYDFSVNGSANGFKHTTLLIGFSDP